MKYVIIMQYNCCAVSLVPRPFMKRKQPAQLTQVQTVDFHCPGVGSTNQILERFMWQLQNFNRHKYITQYNKYTASTWNDGSVRTSFANLCATTTVAADKTEQETVQRYPYTVLSYQIVSPTNGLCTRILCSIVLI